MYLTIMSHHPLNDFFKTLKDETDRIKSLIKEKMRDNP